MPSRPPDPTNPENETWDAIIVGTGMGGGTLGHALAQSGRKVLFLEKGRYLFGEHDRDTGSCREAARMKTSD